MLDKNDLFDRMKLYTETLDEKQNKLYSFLKYIITIASGLIAVLVSLKATPSHSPLIHYLFVGTIGLLTLGILFGSFVLYEEITLLEKLRQSVLENIQAMLRRNENEILIAHIETTKLYRISKKISFSCFILGLISLVVYAVLIDN